MAHYDAGVHRSRGAEHGVRHVIGVLVRILGKVACGTREPTFSGVDTIPLNYWFLTGQQRGPVRIALRHMLLTTAGIDIGLLCFRRIRVL